jgi:hypothetical protein
MGRIAVVKAQAVLIHRILSSSKRCSFFASLALSNDENAAHAKGMIVSYLQIIHVHSAEYYVDRSDE